MPMAFGCCASAAVAYAWLRTHTTGACWSLQRAAQLMIKAGHTHWKTLQNPGWLMITRDYTTEIYRIYWEYVIIQ